MRRSAAFGLAVLFVVYTLNFLDRSLIYILFKPIRQELALGDLQMALLGSTAFVLFYTVLGVPFGRLADRSRRTTMIAVGLAAWSVASAATGWAGSFWTLLACRVGVGIGEATLGPAAYSLLADWFPSNRRATAAAVFSAGIPLGAGLAMALGGVIADSWGWRAAFPVLGLPGLLFAGVLLLIHEPARGGHDVGPSAAAPMLQGSSRVLPLHVIGYAVFNLAAASWSMWIPTYLAGRWDRPLSEVGPIVGACAVVGGLTGTLAGGVIADAVQRRVVGGRLAFGAVASVASGVSWLVLLGTSDWTTAVAATGVGMALALAWLGPASADIQDLVAPGSRATAISVYYFGVNLVGYGLGPPLIGALNDHLGAVADPTQMAVSLLVCPVACGVAAAVLAAAAVMRRSTGALAPA
ncbi:MAG: MFS transporter [Myxococcota bacterium]